MTFEVHIDQHAEDDILDAYRYIRERAPLNAQRWYDGLIEAIFSLEAHPRRHPLAPDHEAFDDEVRQLLYGTYRVLFMIRGAAVYVLHVRHGARDRFES